MNKKIENHVNALFMNAPQTTRVLDIKEELLANLNEKYDDILESGVAEDEAITLVIAGIGDIDNLLKDLGELPGYRKLDLERNMQKSSVFKSIGIALYVLSIVPLLILEPFGHDDLGVVLMFVVCALATAFLVYGGSIGRIKYIKADDSFVEEYKEKIAEKNDRGKLKGALISAIWALVVVIYLAVSFMTRLWHLTWILFLIGAVVQQIVLYSFAKTGKRKLMWHSILWLLTVIIYFILSFATNAWAWTWMVFLVAVAVERIIRLIIIWKNIE